MALIPDREYVLAVALRWICFVALSLLLVACSAAKDEGAAHNDSVSRNNSAPRQYSGVWLYAFEDSTFVEGASEVPKQRPSYEAAAWLDFHPDQKHPGEFVELSKFDDYDVGKKCYPVHPFLITFIGRRTTSLHGSGHLGLWGSEFTVENMISSTPLGPPFCYDG
jgi:hypothetical protein